MKVIYVDIDETICNRESSTDFGTTHDYTKAKPIQTMHFGNNPINYLNIFLLSL